MANLKILWLNTGLYQMDWGQGLMLLVGIVLIYLAIVKKFEPLLLLPIGFGALLSNIPGANLAVDGGILHLFYMVGIESGAFPLIIFMGVGAMTDFGPLLANPKTLLLGAAAQFGIFATLLGAVGLSILGVFDFSLKQAAAIGIIGGADGPTSIYVASILAPELLGAIAVVTVGLGGGIYLVANLGPGPRDGLMIGLQKKTNFPIASVRAFLEISVMSVGWYLGGTVGIGTLLFAFGIGPCVALSLFLVGKTFN